MAEVNFKQIFYSMIKEQQMKLGYESDAVRLYFPETSLYRMLQVSEEAPREVFKSRLLAVAEQMETELGTIKISRVKDRYCFTIFEQGSAFIHEQVPEDPFLRELIALFLRHDVTIDDVISIFEASKRPFVCEKMWQGEFDYMLHFEEEGQDPFYYCVSFRDGHASYHRFHAMDLDTIL